MTEGLRCRYLKPVVHQRSKTTKSGVAKDGKKGKESKKSEANAAARAASIDGVDLPLGWFEKLLRLSRSDLANIIATHVNERNIPFSQIKQGPPSFSATSWDELAPSLGLPDDISRAQFHSYRIRSVLLPPSFHEATAKAAWRVQDVYQERLAQDREGARIRVFDAVRLILIYFFIC
jgi:hypothetical protein